ncbi:response regulator [Tunicatimonas pelagia]|uniref:response regulator n=1 Tax=Tunicatimonas pelagia TaxID=931531 RepID=UPI002665C3DD|nr:response regulator [Tunicatimonas pelagia]WKN45195.1 response regulator [Tunicatimonas pelagia]
MNKPIHSILLVDDDYATNRYNKIIIGDMAIAHEVHDVLDGEEALEVLKDTSRSLPDLILLDINMPRMNGWEFLDELPKLHCQDLDQVKVYMLSASRNPDDVEKAKKYTMVRGFISKPLEPNEVKLLTANTNQSPA